MPTLPETPHLVDAIDALLPQTQCGQCGYAACRPYAAALAENTAAINQCPPGGDSGVQRLADLLGRPVLPLDPAHGRPKPAQVVRIREAECIGCTKCIQACPVDAIVGAPKRLHAVIGSWCTGCELCIPPCPVDCIDILPADPARQPQPPALRRRYLARLARHARDEEEKSLRRAEKLRAAGEHATAAATPKDVKKALILEAMERARQKLEQNHEP